MSNFVVPYVALSTQHTKLKLDRRNENRSHSMLFAPGYNDELLLREGQLETWVRYLNDISRLLTTIP